MKQYLSNNEFTIYTDEYSDKFISIKQIKDSIKALETLGRTITKVLTTIRIDEDGNKHLAEDEFKNICKISRFDGCPTTIINDKYILYNNKYKIRVNKDKSFTDLNGEYVTWISSPIERLTIQFK